MGGEPGRGAGAQDRGLRVRNIFLARKKPKLQGQDIAIPITSGHTKEQFCTSVKERLSGLPESTSSSIEVT